MLLKNPLRAIILTAVTTYLVYIGKFAICMGTSGLCVSILMIKYGSELSSVLFPAIACFMFAALVSSLYMHILEVGVDTLFMCFLIDEDINSKAGVMRAHQHLKDIFGYETKETKSPKRTPELSKVLSETDGLKEVEMMGLEVGGETPKSELQSSSI